MSRLSATAMLQGMADALPTHIKGDDSSDLAGSYEVIGLLVHAYLAAIGFKLCGFNEDSNLCMCLSSPQSLGSCTDFSLAEAESLAPRLPPQWNNGYGSIRFVYAHKQSSMKFVINIDKIGTKVEIRGLALGDENIHRFEKKIGDVVQSRSLPIRITMTEGGEEDRGDLAGKLGKVFSSDEAIACKCKYHNHKLRLTTLQLFSVTSRSTSSRSSSPNSKARATSRKLKPKQTLMPSVVPNKIPGIFSPGSLDRTCPTPSPTHTQASCLI